MPTLSREEISREVRNRIGRVTKTAVLAYVTRARPKLWGTKEDQLTWKITCLFAPSKILAEWGTFVS